MAVSGSTPDTICAEAGSCPALPTSTKGRALAVKGSNKTTPTMADVVREARCGRILDIVVTAEAPAMPLSTQNKRFLLVASGKVPTTVKIRGLIPGQTWRI